MDAFELFDNWLIGMFFFFDIVPLFLPDVPLYH